LALALDFSGGSDGRYCQFARSSWRAFLLHAPTDFGSVKVQLRVLLEWIKKIAAYSIAPS
jgi:hypothetical protein